MFLSVALPWGEGSPSAPRVEVTPHPIARLLALEGRGQIELWVEEGEGGPPRETALGFAESMRRDLHCINAWDPGKEVSPAQFHASAADDPITKKLDRCSVDLWAGLGPAVREELQELWNSERLQVMWRSRLFDEQRRRKVRVLMSTPAWLDSSLPELSEAEICDAVTSLELWSEIGCVDVRIEELPMWRRNPKARAVRDFFRRLAGLDTVPRYAARVDQAKETLALLHEIWTGASRLVVTADPSWAPLQVLDAQVCTGSSPRASSSIVARVDPRELKRALLGLDDAYIELARWVEASEAKL